MPKYKDVSLALRNKIRKDMIVYDDIYGDDAYGVLELDQNEKDLIQECLLWREVIISYFKTSTDAYKMTRIGRFYGVRPNRISSLHGNLDDYLKVKITFEIDSYDKESWMDWFDVKGEADGVLNGSLGTIINERTHPQYYKDGKYIFDKE